MKNRVSPPTAAGKLTNRVKLPACCAAIISTALLSLFAATPALAGNGYEKVTETFGGPCTVTPAEPCPGQFKEPTAIAVNDETNDVYVVDHGNNRVEYFAENGKTYLGEFEAPPGGFSSLEGIAVDNSSEPLDPSKGDVYVADAGHGVIDKFSAAGKYEGQIGGSFSGKLNVAVDPSGNVWVYEAGSVKVYEFNDEGTLVEPVHELESGGAESPVPGFAVDSSGDIYLTGGRPSLFRYSPTDGYAPREFIKQPVSEQATLAIIASNGNLLLDEGSSIELFKSPISEEAQPILKFPAAGLSESAGIAVNGAKGEGAIYATQRGSDDVDVFESEPAKAPVVLSESASSTSLEFGELSAVIDSENRTTTYSFEYSTSKQEVEEGDGTKVPGGTALLAEFGDQTATVATEELIPIDTIYYRVIAENEESKGTPTVGPVEAYTKIPLVENEQVSNLTSTSTDLQATVNPVFEITEYAFEYATEPALLGTPEATTLGNGKTEEGGAPESVSTEIFGLTPGRTYYYRVVAKNGITKHASNANEGKPATGEIKEFKPYAAPAVTTGEAQSITRTAATLSGSVNPESTEAIYHFVYISKAGFQAALEKGAANPEEGETAYQAELAKGAPSPYAEGENTETNALPVSDQPVAVGPIPANDLLPGETYHYALVAVNKYAIQTIGPDRTFTTHTGRPPLVSTGAASGISQNSATLSGTVTTNGLQTNYGFEIATEPNNYGPATGLGAIGGAASETVSVTLSKLQPGRTYYYRVTATNKDGTEKGQPQSFTTPGFPTLIAPPASLPLVATPNIAFPKEEKPSTTTKPLTNKQKLSKALKACHAKHGKKRTACERTARKRFGPVKKRTRA